SINRQTPVVHIIFSSTSSTGGNFSWILSTAQPYRYLPVIILSSILSSCNPICVQISAQIGLHIGVHNRMHLQPVGIKKESRRVRTLSAQITYLLIGFTILLTARFKYYEETLCRSVEHANLGAWQPNFAKTIYGDRPHVEGSCTTS